MLSLRKPLAVAVAVAFSSYAVAEQDGAKSGAQQLDMVVVEGQATAGLDELITEEELNNIQANDLSDVFRANASVSVGGPVGLSQKIYVRNVGEDMLNISVDGAEQAGAVFHHSGRVAVEPELLKQVEIEAGAGSAAAGFGALGGAVRFTTKDPMDLLQPGETAGALVKTGFFSNGSSTKNSATIFAGTKGGKISGMASVVDANFKDVKDGNGDKLVATGVDKKLGYTKVVVQPNEDHKISLSYEALKEEGDILYRPEWKPGPKNPISDTEAKRDTAILNYAFNGYNSLVDFSVNLYSSKSFQKRQTNPGFPYEGYVKNTGGRIQNISLVDNHKLVYGFNFRNDKSLFEKSQFFSQGKIINAPEQEETGKAKGVYFQDVMTLNKKLTVTAGVRYDDYSLEDVKQQKIKDDGYSPNLSANYKLGGGYSVSAGYAQAMRGADVKDAFKLGSSTNAADLKAERSENTELAFAYENDLVTVSAGAYQSVVKNAIAGALPWSKEYINHKDDIKTNGFFANATLTTEQLRLSGSLNVADSKKGGERLTRYAHSSSGVSIGDTLILTADYMFSPSLQAGWNVEMVNDLNGTKLQLDNTEVKVDKPGYSVHDIYARWQPLKNDLLTLSMTVKNLFDKQYLSHASLEDLSANGGGFADISGQPEPGRELRLSAAVRF